ncbi:MAG: hypothetical protein WAT19_03305 [Ferruginibacter sp.]
MRLKLHILILLIACSFITLPLAAQQNDCTNKRRVVNIDFGTAENPQLYNLSDLKAYRVINDRCPDDGHMSFSSSTSTCFWGNWYPLKEDHTAGDEKGKMLLVNASYDPGTFFITNITGLKPNTKYEISLWLINICVGSNGCIPSLPLVEIILSAGGRKLGGFNTGYIANRPDPLWLKYAAFFETGPDAGKVELRIKYLAPGGCGNDFAMDDISIAECIPTAIVKPVEIKKAGPPAPAVKQPVKITAPEPLLSPKTAPQQRQKTEVKLPQRKNSPVVPIITVKERKPAEIKPLVLTERKNSIAKEIFTEASMLELKLYDNGEVDGDTVSIYHNSKLLVSRAGLTAKPFVFKIELNENEPQHEITMVAENLGSIPPNTSLMVITGNKERHEVFISSSKQKNATVLIHFRKK